MDSVDPKEVEEAIGEASEEETSLPESPYSVNIKFWADDYGVLFTMRSSSRDMILNNLVDVIDIIKKNGWQPTWTKEPIAPRNTPVSPPSVPQSPPPTQDGTIPYCNIHNRPMRLFEGRYGRFYKCTFKLDDGNWCNEKANV